MKIRATLLAGAAIGTAALGLSATPAQAQDGYLGNIFMVGYTYCPRNSLQADGQLLAISSNTALFSLYGTTYGGDGRTTFKLPDLRGRVPMHLGQGPGLTNRPQGQSAGTETTTMTVQQMPSHNHTGTITVSRTNATTQSPVNAYFARAAGLTYEENIAPTGDRMNPGVVETDNTGGNQSQPNMQPYQVIRFCVQTQGVFPPRN